MSGYTKGPWHWVDPETDEPATGGYASLRTVEFFGEDKTEVRDGKSYTSFALSKWVLDAEDVSPENARLIAAAPELLEAAIAVISQHDKPIRDGKSRDRFNTLRAAIARATGETK